MAFLWSISNIYLVNIEIPFHFRCCAIHPHEIVTTGEIFFYHLKSDWWPHFSAVKTTEFYCMSPNPCSESGYETICPPYAYIWIYTDVGRTWYKCTHSVLHHYGYFKIFVNLILLLLIGWYAFQVYLKLRNNKTCCKNKIFGHLFPFH